MSYESLSTFKMGLIHITLSLFQKYCKKDMKSLLRVLQNQTQSKQSESNESTRLRNRQESLTEWLKNTGKLRINYTGI